MNESKNMTECNYCEGEFAYSPEDRHIYDDLIVDGWMICPLCGRITTVREEE